MRKIIQHYNIKNKFYYRKNLEKVSKFFLIVFLFVGVINIQYSSAYFSDKDTSLNNGISAGILDISLDNSGVYSSPLLYPTDSTTTSTTLSNAGSLNSKYVVGTTIISNVNSVCDYVTMTATSPTDTYTGDIGGFTSIANATIDTNWDFNFAVSATAPASVWGKTCFFKWTYTAWQENLPNASSGFSSIKEKLGSVRIGKAIVLNEFIPNPSGLDDALMPGGEWVELYNNSNVSVDLSGWVIYDNDDSHELYITNSNTSTGGTIIVAHGFVVVYKNGDSDFNLNNNTDTVRLANGHPVSSSFVVDSYTYTEEKPEAYSYARLPIDGTGDWVDPIPTPGVSNTAIEEIVPVESAKPEELLPSLPEVATSLKAGAPLPEENEDTIPAESSEPEESPLFLPEVATSLQAGAPLPEEIPPVPTKEIILVETVVPEELLPSIPEEIPPTSPEESAEVTE